MARDPKPKMSKPKAKVVAPAGAAAPPPGFASTAAICGLIDLSDRYLRQLVARGVIPRSSNGLFPIASTVRSYVRFVRDDRPTAGKSSAARVLTARAIEIEQRVQRESARLVDIEEHEALFEQAREIIESEMTKLPALASRELATLSSSTVTSTGVAEITATLEKRVAEILAEMTASFRKGTDALRKTGEATTIAEDD